MDVLKVGEAIANARKNAGLTREKLAEEVGVSIQAVSKWERGLNLPDIENLMVIAELTNTPYSRILESDKSMVDHKEINIRVKYFEEDNMFTRMKSFADAEGLDETHRALYYMRDKHLGVNRDKGKYVDELVQYINHPLLIACQAHAYGIKDDALLAAILLHDVVEDTDTTLEELPFSDEVKLLVGLVTKTKDKTKEDYYKAISENGKACVIKILDRCNNVSTIAASFDHKRLLKYINETEEYVLPLTTVLKSNYPEYSDLAFLAKYQILSVIETIKNLIAE